MSAPEPLIIADRELLDSDTQFFTRADMFAQANGMPVPFFTVNDLAKFFFGKTPDWMRWRIRNRFFASEGNIPDCPHGVIYNTGRKNSKGQDIMDMDWWFVKRLEDGTQEDGSRDDEPFYQGKSFCRECDSIDYADHIRAKAGARIYSLYDIEQMGHAMAQKGGIDGSTLSSIIILVKTTARIYGYI